jgi:dipeptide/tripeptide permease
MAMLYASLYIIALGAGGIKANCSGFGSDQFDIRDPKEEKEMIFFFNRYIIYIYILATSLIQYRVCPALHLGHCLKLAPIHLLNKEAYISSRFYVRSFAISCALKTIATEVH